ncbi:MAG: hypothetical protein QOE45_1537 [Frankiaceae bacterium]|nr:hypothetical protein [Frankiaceae bacterium]
MHRSTRPAATAATTLIACALLSACAPRGLAFRVDKRVSFRSPRDRATVTLPVTLDWDATGFAGTFAVFLDRTPMPPGRSLRWLARNDVNCVAARGCPDAEYLRERGVYPTTETQLTLAAVPKAGTKNRHRATIVLLDADGQRIGESAFELEFTVVGAP